MAGQDFDEKHKFQKVKNKNAINFRLPASRTFASIVNFAIKTVRARSCCTVAW